MDADPALLLTVTCDHHGVILGVDGPLDAVLGHQPEGVIGRPIGEFLHERNQAVAAPIVMALAGKPNLELWDEIRVPHADGSWRWLRASIRGGESGGGALVVVASPIDDAQAELLDAAHVERDATWASEHRFRLLAEAAPIGVFQQSPTGGCTYVNQRWTEITGLSAEEAMGDGWLRILHPDDAAAAFGAHDEQMGAAGGTQQVTFRILRPDGEVRWVEVGTAVVAEEGVTHGSIVGTMEDVTATKHAEARAVRLGHILESTPDLVGFYDLTEERTYINDAGRRFWNLRSASDVEPDLVELEALQGQLPAHLVAGWVDHILPPLLEHGTWSGELETVRADGVAVPMHGLLLCRKDAAGTVQGFAGVFRDITERKAMEERLEHQATHDPLSGLPNRILLLDRLEVALHRIERTGGRLDVLFLDLDRFKVVNDSLGHALGDRVLVALAERIRSCVGEDRTVARFGGDEFVVLVEDAADDDAVATVAERIADAMARPVELDRDRFVVTTSIGIATSEPGATAESLLRDADAAMYRAKAAGRSRAVVFEPSMRIEALDRFDVEAALRRAIVERQLRVEYQPKVDLRSGKIVGVEALVRWDHPTRGRLLPADFLDVAIETGLIVQIGAWVIDQAFADLVRFDAVRPAGRQPLYLCLNLCATELADAHLPEVLAAARDRHGVDPAHIDLELTEHTLMADVEATTERLRLLGAMGYKIAVDDFGTGYSSLAYLRRFPVDLLKVDRTFVDGLGGPDGDEVIVRAVVAIAESMGVAVVAEGVETPEQLATLRHLGCTMAQGFLLAHPQSAQAIVDLLAQDPTY